MAGRYGYIVLCKDCGFQQVEPTKQLAKDTKREHRIDHYGHNVEIERKAYHNKTDWDLNGYLEGMRKDPHFKHNKFAKQVIHGNYDDHNIVKKSKSKYGIDL